MADCLFCKIIAKEIPSEFVYEDGLALAFKDIHPAAAHHYLIVPRHHVATVNDATADNQALLGHLFVAAGEIARKFGFADSGYRLIVNCNKDAGQVIFHLHVHLLAGKRMGWTPA